MLFIVCKWVGLNTAGSYDKKRKKNVCCIIAKLYRIAK